MEATGRGHLWLLQRLMPWTWQSAQVLNILFLPVQAVLYELQLFSVTGAGRLQLLDSLLYGLESPFQILPFHTVD